jgi:hypothetical protein
MISWKSVDVGEKMKDELLALAYEKEHTFGSDERREFDCLIALILDGAIKTFSELAEYGVEKD